MSDISSGDAHLQPIKIPLQCNDSVKQEIKEELKGKTSFLSSMLGKGCYWCLLGLN